MRQYLFIISLFIFFVLNAKTHSVVNIDSLHKALSFSKNSEEEMSLLLKITRYYGEIDIEKSNEFSFKLSDLAKENGNLKFQHFAQRILGINYANQGNYRKSINHYSLCIQ